MINFGGRSLGDLVRIKAQVNGNKPLVVYGDTSISYEEFDLLTDKVANAFASLGMKRAERAVILMWNDPWTWIVWLGLAKLGCWVAFVNPHYKGQSLDYLIERIDPHLLVAHSDVADEVLLTPTGQSTPLKVMQELPGTAPQPSASMLSLASLIEKSAAHAPDCEVVAEDIAGMVHTSGTTGMPKFCLLSHSYYYAQGMIQVRKMGVMPSDRFHLSMPLYHAHKHLINVFLSDASIFLSPKFNVAVFWQEVKDSRSTLLMIHDQPLVMLLKQPPGPLDRSHGARLVHPGFRMQRQFHERFGVDVVSGIGSNESQTVAWAPWYRSHVDPNYYDSESPGLEIISDYCEVKIVDGDDNEVALGQIGEITSKYKLPHMQFEGYYNDPEKTAEVFKGGWLHHGDLGRIDEKGLLHFVGRKAESIRHRGEWVARELVENAANSHPLVKESVVVGVPSGLGDKDLKLYVVPKGAASIDPPDLLDHLSGRLPYFMIPRYVECIESLPRTPGLEKIRWRDLSALGVGNAWDRQKAGYKLKRST